MSKKKICMFVPCDGNNLKFFNQLEKSLHHFHPDLELIRFDNPNPHDRDFWYRAKPVIAKGLLDEYDTVIGADADQIILAPLDDILNDTDKFDVGVVLNDPSWPIRVWDINWPMYNNGLVVMKSRAFVEHWERLCFTPHFDNYQYREQDLLNLLCSDYFNYTVKQLDSDKIYGEWAKPLWVQSYIKDDKVYIPTKVGEKQLCVYHSGGGATPDKGNYRIRFPQQVVHLMDELIK